MLLLYNLKVALHSFRRAILQNWLCNPTGKEDGWRGWDWLQELNNLYTKVSIYYEATIKIAETEIGDIRWTRL